MPEEFKKGDTLQLKGTKFGLSLAHLKFVNSRTRFVVDRTSTYGYVGGPQKLYFEGSDLAFNSHRFEKVVTTVLKRGDKLKCILAGPLTRANSIYTFHSANMAGNGAVFYRLEEFPTFGFVHYEGRFKKVEEEKNMNEFKVGDVVRPMHDYSWHNLFMKDTYTIERIGPESGWVKHPLFFINHSNNAGFGWNPDHFIKVGNVEPVNSEISIEDVYKSFPEIKKIVEGLYEERKLNNVGFEVENLKYNLKKGGIYKAVAKQRSAFNALHERLHPKKEVKANDIKVGTITMSELAAKEIVQAKLTKTVVYKSSDLINLDDWKPGTTITANQSTVAYMVMSEFPHLADKIAEMGKTIAWAASKTTQQKLYVPASKGERASGAQVVRLYQAAWLRNYIQRWFA